MSFLYWLLGTLFATVSVLMILLILIQKGRGGGLSSAFGGAGGNTAFGSKTGDVLTWVTASVFGLFLLLSVGLVWTSDAVFAADRRVDPDVNIAADEEGDLAPSLADEEEPAVPLDAE
jgi:preprotein translocase subunit SecG